VVLEWSWAETAEEVKQSRERARALIAERLSSVTYITLDYRAATDRPVGLHGPRLAGSPAELAAPVWDADTFDWADYAVEFVTASGRVFTVSWDAPGWHEGIWLREVGAAGAAFKQDADVAVWDVSHSSHWDSFIDDTVTDVAMHYRPWTEDGGYWCSRITLHFGDRHVDLLLGESDSEHRLVPSADTIAVVFPPAPLPHWQLDQG
jgi:hypothetical protein